MKHTNINSNAANQMSFGPGFPIRLYFARSEQSVGAPLHRHNELELVLVQRGTLKLMLSGDSVEFTEGQGALINSGVMHSLNCSEGCLCAYIMFSDDFIAPSNSDISIKYIKPLVMNSMIPYVPLDGRFSWQDTALQCTRRVFALLCRYSSAAAHIGELNIGMNDVESCCYELEVLNLISKIWCTIYSGLEGAVRSSAPGNEYAARRRTQLMTDFIRRNYNNSITLAEIAAAANISKSEAARCFQTCLHISPVSYLLRYRVEMAEQLLQNTTMTIEDIGFECGFSSASYFCKMFQRHTGLTPGQFRKEGKTPATS